MWSTISWHSEIAAARPLLIVSTRSSSSTAARVSSRIFSAAVNRSSVDPGKTGNKIDLPGADPERISEEIEAIIGLDTSNAITCSAKTGLGVPDILQAVVDRVPPPPDRVEEPLRALIFDSYYDPYRGVIVYFRVISGSISKRDKVLLMASKKTYELDEVGVMAPDQRQVESLHAGEVGYLAASIKAVADASVGDTVTDAWPAPATNENTSRSPAVEMRPWAESVGPVSTVLAARVSPTSSARRAGRS